MGHVIIVFVKWIFFLVIHRLVPCEFETLLSAGCGLFLSAGIGKSLLLLRYSGRIEILIEGLVALV